MKSILTLFALASTLACSAGPPVRYYSLEPLPAPQRETQEHRLGVVPFAVEAPYDDTRLVFRAEPDSPRLDFYAYHRWASPVGQQVASLVADELSGRVPGHLVEVAFAGRDYAALVHGRVLRLEEVDRPDAIETRVILEIELRSPAGEVWSVERVESRQQTPAASVDDVVRMMQQALGEAVERALPRLVATLAERSVSTAGEGR